MRGTNLDGGSANCRFRDREYNSERMHVKGQFRCEMLSLMQRFGEFYPSEITSDERWNVRVRKTMQGVTWEPKRQPTEVADRSLDKRLPLVPEVDPGTDVHHEE